MANIFFKKYSKQTVATYPMRYAIRSILGIAKRCHGWLAGYMNSIASDTRERKLENGKLPDGKQLEKIIH